MHAPAINLTPPLRHAGGNGAMYDMLIANGTVRISGFGRFYKGEEQDWTFRHLTKPSDVNVECSITRHLPTIAKDLDIEELLVPSPLDFNAEICSRTQLSTRIELGGGESRVVLRRGVRADGCLLKPQQAYAVSAAGCAVLVLSYLIPKTGHIGQRKPIGATHVALRSAIDFAKATGNGNLRPHESVVDTLLSAMQITSLNRDQIRGDINFAISSQMLTYPWDCAINEEGKRNEQICTYIAQTVGEKCLPNWDSDRTRGNIDLYMIIRKQLIKAGLSPTNIHGSAKLDLLPHTDGQEMWYTTRGKFPQRRNLAIVTHYA